MQFKLATLATLLAVAAAAPAKRDDPTCAPNVVAVLNTATDLASFFTSVPSTIQGLADNIRNLSSGAGLPGQGQLSEEEQKQICAATSGLVTADTQLVQILSGKQGLLASTPFTAPLASVGRVLEGATEICLLTTTSLTFSSSCFASKLIPSVQNFLLPIVDATPACGSSVTDLVSTLNQGLDQLIEGYSQ
ncbi:hypothetical protein BJY01DRAFT_254977 [Aspergillus pseudoustus]|uniref:Hydrophobic surface binding protein A-domain-containing protein n=1 Tax=Aspergillus pseudoustus TaxID=1810923 RepID=A0ABR4IPG9_9EURO